MISDAILSVHISTDIALFQCRVSCNLKLQHYSVIETSYCHTVVARKHMQMPEIFTDNLKFLHMYSENSA